MRAGSRPRVSTSPSAPPSLVSQFIAISIAVAIIAADNLKPPARAHVAHVLGVSDRRQFVAFGMAVASIRPDTEFRADPETPPCHYVDICCKTERKTCRRRARKGLPPEIDRQQERGEEVVVAAGGEPSDAAAVWRQCCRGLRRQSAVDFADAMNVWGGPADEYDRD